MRARTLIRIPCASRAEAKDLALRLEADGYATSRRRRSVTARTESREAAELLARKLHLQPGRPGRALIREPHLRGRFGLTAKTATSA